MVVKYKTAKLCKSKFTIPLKFFKIFEVIYNIFLFFCKIVRKVLVSILVNNYS